MPKVLLLGGSVFVGNAVRRHLAAQGFDVTAVTRGSVQMDWGSTEHIACDRRDSERLAALLHGRAFDAVVDTSCYTASDCASVLAALGKRPDAYILLSSAAVYSRSACALPFSESAPATGDDIWGTYGTDKAEAEAVLLRSGIARPFVLRPPYISGAGNNLDRERFIWARQLAGDPIFVPADGETLIQFLSIGDLCRAIVGLLQPTGSVEPGIYNLADESFFSFNQYIELLGKVSGHGSDLHYVADGTIPAREYFPFRKAHLILSTQKLAGWGERPQTRLLHGLQAAFDWVSTTANFVVPPSSRELALRSGRQHQRAIV